MAMLHGVVIGVVAIAIVGFILVGADGKRPIDKIKEEIPASGPSESTDTAEKQPAEPGESLQLFARQHAVFTTSAAAATFIAAEPSLATAAIIQADGQYYVWSAVGVTEAEIEKSAQAETYQKVFNVNTSACEGIGAKKLKEILAADEIAKIKISDGQESDEKVQAFNRQLDAITAFTNDLTVIRLHLLSQYSYAEDCAKISF